MSELKNPMRFSMHSRRVDMTGFDVEVTEIEIRPSEGQVYVHWSETDE